MKYKTDFFEYPIKSSSMNIFKIKNDTTETIPMYWKLELIASKLFAMENNVTSYTYGEDSDDEDDEFYSYESNYRVFFPILHTSSL